jgi:hypothetical protein
MSGADLYYWFASGFGSLEHLYSPHLSPFDVPIIGSVVSLSVQFFFAYRVWILSAKKSWQLCVIICLVSWSHHSSLSPPTYSLRYSQCATVDTAAAFVGGIYVSPVRRVLLSRLMMADRDASSQQIRQRADT